MRSTSLAVKLERVALSFAVALSASGPIALAAEEAAQSTGASALSNMAPPADNSLVRQEGRVDYSAPKVDEVDEIICAGLKSYEAGDLDAAEASFNKVLEAHPDNADALFNLGALDEKRGDLESALRRYRAALSISPQEKDIEQAVGALADKVARQKAYEASERARREFESAVERAKSGSHTASVRSSPYPVLPVTQGPPARVETGSSRSKVVARVATGVAVGVAIGLLAGGVGGGLHCPMCRIMRLGF